MSNYPNQIELQGSELHKILLKTFGDQGEQAHQYSHLTKFHHFQLLVGVSQLVSWHLETALTSYNWYTEGETTPSVIPSLNCCNYPKYHVQ